MVISHLLFVISHWSLVIPRVSLISLISRSVSGAEPHLSTLSLNLWQNQNQIASHLY
ncbi:MAG: hypothetical protein RMZ69_08315 [Nostoc sp. ChiQUE01a]|nr:hypothetical protein [Nostoc sp. ChiQUE01a]